MQVEREERTNRGREGRQTARKKKRKKGERKRERGAEAERTRERERARERGRARNVTLLCVQVEEAFSLFAEMEEGGIKANLVTFTSLISACRHGDRWVSLTPPLFIE
jgi:uncharacterized membrane protein YdbT with pleckstrin-like domain